MTTTTPAEAVFQPTIRRDRRRDKPQLSCNFCRRRKMRCDRQLPCKTCVNKGMPLSCAYTPGPQRAGAKSFSVGDRIKELEDLVKSLAAQQQSEPGAAVTAGNRSSSESQRLIFPEHRPLIQSPSLRSGTFIAGSSSSKAETDGTNTLAATSSPSEHGSIRMDSQGSGYVSGLHWSAVLDSISLLKDHYEEEEEARMQATFDRIPSYQYAGPRLLYEPVEATKSDILASIPPRPVVDRIISRYFNAEGAIPAVIHSPQFFREYESFWQAPTDASFKWIGLLFSIMCCSTHFQHLIQDDPDPDAQMRVHTFRERTIQCLILGEYTKGGKHVLETMIHYCAIELVLCKEADIGLWLLQSMLVRLALSSGYHRDPRNFSNLSPFAGEMRRRVWMFILQMDLRLSSQMGLPRLLKFQHSDTAKPRNLLDTDFDEDSTELPLSRPDTEITPVLYGLAKSRMDDISGEIGDFVADTREHSYQATMELDRKLHKAEEGLPSIFQWQPLSQSLMVPPLIVVHRMWLQLASQRLTIWLHRKYLAPRYTQPEYKHSRDACVQAAIRILEFQQLVEEELRPDGLIYPVRGMLTSLLQSVFLLGMSILSYYMQYARTSSGKSIDQDTRNKIFELLRSTYPIWLRSSTVSREARRAVQHLATYLPELQTSEQGIQSPANDATLYPATPQDASMSLDQVGWDAYQDCITGFPPTFGFDFVSTDEP